MNTENSTRYEYKTGHPSWHQAKAGHTYAGQITCQHTPEEHAEFVRKHHERGEPITWKDLDQERRETAPRGSTADVPALAARKNGREPRL